jgi:hypothetical protein
MRGTRWLVPLLALALCGCSSELETERASAHASQGWQARRFLPYDPAWRPLSEVPVEPQENPAMVIWEVSQFPADEEPSPTQRTAADDLIQRCYDAAVRNGWLDFEKALRDGYIGLFQDRRHYANWEFIADDAVLDPDRPEFLMYYATPDGMQLIGFMFYTDELEAHGPQVGGPLTVWHYHKWSSATCFRGNLLPIGKTLESGRCLTGEPSYRSPEMLHVWLVDRPGGPFASNMYIEPERFPGMLEKRRKERGEPW